MVFLLSVWAMLIVGIACVDDIYHKLSAPQAVLYLAGLVAVCAIDYIAFSVTTLYYVGYPLLIAYIIFACYRHWRNRTVFICGNCGTATQAQRPLPILWSHERLKHPDFPRVFQEMIRPPW